MFELGAAARSPVRAPSRAGQPALGKGKIEHDINSGNFFGDYVFRDLPVDVTIARKRESYRL